MTNTEAGDGLALQGGEPKERQGEKGTGACAMEWPAREGCYLGGL